MDAKRKYERASNKVEKIKEQHGDNPGQTHTYHAGWNLGFWVGRLSVLEELLEEEDE
ncbi:hypothetical protein [Bacillus safensis]|uniref:hypothetical protein n=2 Tax=Bacillus TaxID=1386 RepID=UPI0020CC9BBD|nr:hypothetical protein [Bacillus safensis]MCP9283012.1 hypothetical protein [Bacillus safensis]